MVGMEINFSGKGRFTWGTESASMCVDGEGCGPGEATASGGGGDRD